MLSTNRFYAFAMIWILLLCGACTVRAGDSDSMDGSSKDKGGDVNFDQCISPDVSTLYFDDGVYTGSGQLLSASIAIAHRNGEQFARLKDGAKIMKQINQDGWNYAPDISKSGLEFFFTRFNSTQSGALPTIYTATRSKVSKPFGKPQKIAAITGFAEAPALSPDEKSLYYHLNAIGTFVIYRVTRRDATPRRYPAARRSLPTCNQARAVLPRYAARVRALPPLRS
jgi:WD40 repeat protein